MKNKIVQLMIAALLLVCMTACGAQTEPESTSDAPVSGGWTLTAPEAVVLPETVKDAFSQAAVGDNAGLIPVAFVGEQTVEGKNYMLLCAEDGGYRMIVIYQDLQGKAELTQSKDFVLTDYTQGKSTTPGEALVGGWAVPDSLTVLPLPENAQTAFDKALGEFTGSNIEPMALLGTQVVAGTNYAILCRVTPVVPDAVSTVQVVTVYADLQGNAEFTDFCTLDQASYNK